MNNGEDSSNMLNNGEEAPTLANTPLWKLENSLRDYLAGYTMRETMITFETAMSPVAKELLEKHFPGNPAQKNARDQHKAKQLQLETELDLLKTEIQQLIQRMKDEKRGDDESKQQFKDRKKDLGGKLKVMKDKVPDKIKNLDKIKEELNEEPLLAPYIVQCR
jgi:uncharacterized protein YhaN